MIRVVDARMGTGKTSAAIQYMNDHPGKRYLFVTPFIDETKRVQCACPDLHFWIPNGRLSEYEFRKSSHLRALVEDGANIAMTHALFKMCDGDVVKMITEKKYVIFIDEVIDVFTPLAISNSDIKIVTDSGWLKGGGTGEQTNYEYFEVDAEKRYQGGLFNDLFVLAKSHRLINISEAGSKNRFYFWALHKELLALSDEVYILTYLFDGMPMKALIEMNHIPYEYIGVAKDDEGAYRFTDTPTADSAPFLKDLIHICDNDRLNAIGDRDTALSATWTKSAVSHMDDGRIVRLRRNLNTFFRNYVPADIKVDGRLWCTFKEAMGKVRDKGFYHSSLAWTSRATNNYRDRSALAYCVNVYLNPNIQNYFAMNGVNIDPDKYALANMVQWLWRGCIRSGEEMWVYIPSRRMRNLLIKWLDQLSKEEM